jgi:FKBP-type peptidyl-prolyl cis-trans isomerase SlyD
MIKNGSVVSFEYMVSDENEKVLESTKGLEPVTYTQGQQEIIPALEKEISEMDINEEKNISIPPEEAYGTVDPEGFKEVPKDEIPAQKLTVGATVDVCERDGEDLEILSEARSRLRVREIKEETVVLDLNHPLAGKTLNFRVRVLDVRPST